MSGRIEGQYFGKTEPLLWLYVKTALLTLVTLGIYRFWAKTRIRKYVWSATSGENDGFEYTGTGLEKFLGFLVALVILAVYLGLFQLLLTFLGLAILPQDDSPTAMIAQSVAINLNFLAVMPLLLFAQYRARRYKMARTRWRGLRFGMENGAWGYVGRALWYTFLSSITLGILAPLATFRLEKYMVDRSWYGDAQFELLGRWQALYPGMKHVFIGMGLLVGATAMVSAGIYWNVIGAIVFGGLFVVVAYVWIIVGTIIFRVYSFNYLTRNAVLDEEVVFEAHLDPTHVVMKVLIGFAAATIAPGIILGILGAIVGAVFFAVSMGGPSLDTGGAIEGLAIGGTVLFALGYVSALLLVGAIWMVMVTQPIVAHAVTNITVHNSDHLELIRQRSADKGADAEGFADALDIGGAL